MNCLNRLRILNRQSLITKTCLRTFSSETDNLNTTTEVKISGYAKAFDKFEQIKDEPPQKEATFASLLRNSKFIDVRMY